MFETRDKNHIEAKWKIYSFSDRISNSRTQFEFDESSLVIL
jgi:hypothetical protein